MWRHFVNLLIHSWQALMAATSTNTLGFCLWTVLVAAITYFATILATALTLRKKGVANPLKQAFEESLLTGVLSFAGVSILVVLAWAAFIVPTVFRDHQAFGGQNQQLLTESAGLRKNLEWRKHNISTTDAVFPNLIYMLQAFRSFKFQMNGERCVLYISAPKETEALASVVAQLAGPDSGCAGFGPVRGDNPDLDPELTIGEMPEAIVVHALKGEKAADGLFSTLGNQIHLERSYRMLRKPQERWSPVRPREHVVWLQFGSRVQWNSELR